MNNNRTTALEWTAAEATGGLNAFYWHQISALYFVVPKTQFFSSHGGFIIYANSDDSNSCGP